MSLSLRLDQSTKERLDFLAKETGRTKTYYVKKMILEKLDDFEDIYLSEKALSQLENGEDKLISDKEFWNEVDG